MHSLVFLLTLVFLLHIILLFYLLLIGRSGNIFTHSCHVHLVSLAHIVDKMNFASKVMAFFILV